VTCSPEHTFARGTGSSIHLRLAESLQTFDPSRLVVAVRLAPLTDVRMLLSRGHRTLRTLSAPQRNPLICDRRRQHSRPPEPTTLTLDQSIEYGPGGYSPGHLGARASRRSALGPACRRRAPGALRARKVKVRSSVKKMPGPAGHGRLGSSRWQESRSYLTASPRSEMSS